MTAVTHLTTQSNQAVSAANGSSTFQTLSLANSNGVSFSTGTQGIFATVKTDYLTTARASTDAIGLNTAQSNVTWTVNSSGISFDARGYAGTNTTFNGTNASASITLNSAGLRLDLSAAAAGAGGGVAVSAGGSNFISGTVTFGNTNGASFITTNGSVALSFSTAPAGSLIFGSSNNVTFGTSTAGATTTVTASYALNVSAGTTSSGYSALTFSNSNGVSFGINGGVITASAAGAGGGGAAIKGSGTYTQNTGTVEFANSNGITFGLSNNGTMTASHNGITQQSTQPVAISGSNGSFTFSTVSFGNSNGASFYTTNGSVVASYTVPSTAGLISAINVSAGTTSNNLTAVTYNNSNGVSFGINGSVITATVKTDYLTTARASNDAIGLNTAQTNVTWTVNSSGISINAGGYAGTGATTASTAGSDFAITQGTNGLSMGVPKYLTTAMQSNAATISNINLSAGTTSSNLSAFVLSNSNNVSFGLNGATVTATATFSQSVQTQNVYQAVLSGNTAGAMATISSGTMTIAGGNNITVSQNGNAFTISGPNVGGAQTGISGIVVSNTTYTSGTVTFQNANGISFGSSGINGISASYTVPSTAGLLSAINVSAGTTSSNQSSIGFSNANSVSFGFSGASITASIPNFLTTARASTDAIGLNTALTAGPLALTVNSSGLSLNAGSAAGTTSGFGGNLISGSMTHNTAGLNLSLNHPAWLTTAMQSNAATISNINISAGTTSTNASAFTFNNANGITFGLGTGASAGSITASHNGLTTARASTDAIGLNTAQSNVTWTVNSSGLSLDARGYAGTASTFNGTNVSGSITLNSNGLRLDLSAANAAAGNVTFSAGTTSSGLAAVTFSNANGVSFGLGTGANAGVMTASVSTGDPDGWAINGNTAGANSTYQATNGTLYFSGGANITLSQNGSTLGIIGGAGGGGGAAISAGTNSQNTGTVNFSNSNNISFGLNTNGVMTASVSGGNLYYSNGSGVTWGTAAGGNSTTVTASVALNATMQRFDFMPVGQMSSSQQTNNSVSIRYFQVNQDVSFTRLDIPINFSIASTTTSNTAAIAFTSGAVIYTRNGSTLSPIVGQLASTTYSWASNTANYSSVIGGRYASFNVQTVLSPGDYWLGVLMSTNTSSVGAATTSLGNTISVFIGSTLTAQNFAEFGNVTSASTTGYHSMQGLVSVNLTATNQTYQWSQISQSGAPGGRANIYFRVRNN